MIPILGNQIVSDKVIDIIEDPEKFKKDKEAITSMFVHAADLGASAKKFSLANKWNRKIVQEFSEQVITYH